MKLTVLKVLSIIWLMVLCGVIDSCRSHKDIQRDVSAATDSVGTSASHRSLATLDTMYERLCLDFDTLDITVDRLSMGDTTETFRLRAVKGRVASNRSQHRQAVEVKTRLDSTAYKISSADRSAEHTATTVAYEPPNTTIVIGLSIAVALLLLFLYFKRK